MPSGRTIYNQIKDQESAAETEVSNLSESLSQVQWQIKNDAEKRADQLVALAGIYMDAQTAGQLGGRLSQITGMLNDMQAAKQERRQSVEGLIRDTKARREELARALEDARRQERAASNELFKEVGDADREAQATPRWKELAQALAQNGEQIKKADLAKARATKLMEEKRQAYEANPEFAYLIRHQGQKPSILPWIRMGDEMLAQRLNFPIQYRRYQELLSRPKRIGALIAEANAEQAKRQEEQESIVAEAHERHQAGKLEAIRDQRAKLRASLERQAAALDKELTTLQGELKEILENRSDFESSLKTEVQALLAKLNPEELLRAAAQTKRTDDDAIAATIQELGNRIQSGKAKAKELESRIADVQATVDKMHRLRRNFENADYHDSSSEFSSFNLSNLLAGYALGSISEASIWNSIQNAQSWHREETYSSPSYSSSSSSSWGSSSSSDSSSSSSWSTSSSAGDSGGWSTSGGI